MTTLLLSLLYISDNRVRDDPWCHRCQWCHQPYTLIRDTFSSKVNLFDIQELSQAMRGNEGIATQMAIKMIVIQIAIQISPCVLANPSDYVPIKNHHLLPLARDDFVFFFLSGRKHNGDL